MDTDLVSQLLTMRNAATQGSVQQAMLKKQHEMDMSLVTMMADATKSAPPPGQGLVVDKTA